MATFKEGDVFGETVAESHDKHRKRNATVCAVVEGSCWTLSRAAFHRILGAFRARKNAEFVAALDASGILVNLPVFHKYRIASGFTEMFYAKGDEIIKQVIAAHTLPSAPGAGLTPRACFRTSMGRRSTSSSPRPVASGCSTATHP